MNRVILMGRLTKDPNVRYTTGENQTAVARFTLAVDRKFAKRDDPNAQTADFIGCMAFGKLGEFADKYLRQGTKIALAGRIQTGKYQNSEGQTVYTTDVVAEEIEFAESKRDSNAGVQDPRQEKKQDDMMPTPAVNTAQAVAQTADAFVHVDSSVETDLPFA